MATFENLEIIIDVIVAGALEDINQVILKLEQLEQAIGRVDGDEIDLSVLIRGTIRAQEKINELDSQEIKVPLEITGVVSEVVKVQSAIEALEAQSIDIPVNFLTPRGIGLPETGRTDMDVDGRQIGFDMDESLKALLQNKEILGALSGAGGTEDGRDALGRFTETVDDEGRKFRLRMSDMHNALAQVVPLLLTFIGALPALVTAVVALAAAAISAAGALFALGGLGAIGFALAAGEGKIGEGFKEIIKDIRESFLDAFRPLIDRLTPLFEDALDGLDKLFAAIAARGDILLNFRDDARAFGRFILDFIPDVLAEMGRMADAFGPTFGMFADFLKEMGFLRGLAGFFAAALPSLLKFLDALISVLPVILEISLGFLEASAAVINLINIFSQLLGIIDIFGVFAPEALGLFVGAMLSALTIAALLNSQLIITALRGVVTLGELAVLAAGKLIGLSAAEVGAAVGAGILSKALFALAGAITTVLAATGVGLLLPLLGGIASQFIGVSGSVDKATSSLSNFADASSRIDGMSVETSHGRYEDPTRGTVSADRFSGSRGGGVTIINNGTKEENDAQMRRTLWRMGKQTI